jgi:glycosyltransferase involved in cell wall biosynthesis
MPGDKINILFLMIQMAMGGAERLVYNLARHIDRDRFAPSIGWFVQDEPLKEFEELGIPLYYIPKRKRFDWEAMSRIAQIVRTQSIDVVNAHHFMPFFYAYYGAKVVNNAGLVYTEHSGNDILLVTGKWRPIGRYLLKRSDAAVGVSEAVSRTIGAHFGLPPGKIHTIENGVDLSLFSREKGGKVHPGSRFGFPPTDVIVGIVANFRKIKNHLFLLKAFREVEKEKRGVKLVLAGQGFPGDPESTEQVIRDFIRENGLEDNVLLLGYRPDVHELLRMMDIFCLVSYREGLPISLIEGMASGLPILGTNAEGIREVVDPDENGLVVEPDDVPGLTQALHRLIGDSDLRRRMGESSRRKAEAQYSLRRCIEETERLFISAYPRALPGIGNAGGGCAAAVRNTVNPRAPESNGPRRVMV